MVFCHPNQAKIDACDALSPLCQHNSSEPNMVVVRRYSNTPYIPWGMSHLLYLDVGTLSGGASSTWFPLDRLCLWWLILFSRTEVLLPCEEGEERLEMYPHLPEILWESSEEEHCLSDLISLLVPMSAPPPHLEEGNQTEGGSDCHAASAQMEGAGFHPALKLLQDNNQAIAQLEYELIQETQELAERYKHKQAKQARRHARWWAQMINQTDATFQEVFSQASLTEAVKLLSWCISTAVPFCYISIAVTTAAQQDEGIPTIHEPCPTASQSEPHGTLAPGPSGGLTPPPGTSPLPESSLPDIPLAGTPLVRCPFSDFLAVPTQGKQDQSPSSSPDHHNTKRTHVWPRSWGRGWIQLYSGWTRHTGIDSRDWTWAQLWTRRVRTCQSSQPSSAMVGSVVGTASESLKNTKDPASSSSELSWGNVDDSDTDTASGDCLSCSDTDELLCKLPARSTGRGCGLQQAKQKQSLDGVSTEEDQMIVILMFGEMITRSLGQSGSAL